MMPALPIGLQRVHIRGAHRLQTVLLFRGHFDANLSHNRGSKGALQRERVPEIAFIALRKNVLVLWRIDELSSDAHTVAGSLNGAFDESIHIELAGNFGERLV